MGFSSFFYNKNQDLDPHWRKILDIEKLYSISEVAALLHISERQVNKLVRSGQLQAVTISNRKRLFTVAQIDSFIKSRSFTATLDCPPKAHVKSRTKGGAKSVSGSRADLLKEVRSL